MQQIPAITSLGDIKHVFNSVMTGFSTPPSSLQSIRQGLDDRGPAGWKAIADWLEQV